MMHRGFIQKIFAEPAVIVHPEDVQQRRFACTGWPHYRYKVTLLDVQIDLAQDVKKLLLRERITAFQISKLDHTFTRRVMPGRDPSYPEKIAAPFRAVGRKREEQRKGCLPR